MCGIVGVIQRDAPVSRELVGLMRDRLQHRGPDDAGLYFSPDNVCGLGHRRLSIIDLSPQGHQPMSNEDGSVWIAFNGEIYNFAELREQLTAKQHRFKSRTDTEVIVHAYEEYGVNCVDHLRGMFAFAIWDERHHQLFLARDRFGMKPLYYYHDRDRFAFASELKALVACPTIPKVLDETSLYDYLSYRYVPTPKTIYRNIYKLPPAHTLMVRERGDDFEVSSRRYWDIDFTPDDSGAAVKQLLPDIAAAVDSHMISDVPLGAFLSGGVDSSLICGVARNCLHIPLKSFTVGFDDDAHSEAPYARQVAYILQTEHHEVTASLGSLDDALANVIEFYDEPFADGSAIPTHRVCALTRKHVTVALSGDGGDELFGGYSWYQRWLKQRAYDSFWSLVPASGRDWATRHAPNAWKIRSWGRNLLLTPLEQYLRNIGMFTRYEKHRMLTAEFGRQFADYDDVWQLRQHWRPELEPLSAMQYLDIHTYLPDDILTKVDRASMAVSLEVRIPFLDHPLAENAARLPRSARLAGDQSKVALKNILSSWLPPELIHRAKHGFSAPWGRWLKPQHVRERLVCGELVRRGILDLKWVQTTEGRQLGGGKGWALLVLDEWLKRKGT